MHRVAWALEPDGESCGCCPCTAHHGCRHWRSCLACEGTWDGAKRLPLGAGAAGALQGLPGRGGAALDSGAVEVHLPELTEGAPPQPPSISARPHMVVLAVAARVHDPLCDAHRVLGSWMVVMLMAWAAAMISCYVRQISASSQRMQWLRNAQ